MTTKRKRPVFDTDLILDDMMDRGWLGVDLARAVSASAASISRFLSGESQSLRLAARIAEALGRPVRDYVLVLSKSKRTRQAVAS